MGAFVMRFKNRADAGERLGRLLAAKYEGDEGVVYALPRGGVVLAAQVARRLRMPLDLIIARKIGHPYNPEYAIAAVTENGDPVVNADEVARVPSGWFDVQVAKERREARRRHHVYLDGRAPLPCRGKTAIVVDDGIATGLTMQAAIRELRRREPARIVIAVPIAPAEAAAAFRDEVDDLVALDAPEYYLGGVGAYYDDFPQVSDSEVIALLRQANGAASPSVSTTSPPLDLARKVALLKDPRTYPLAPARIDTVETHMSWVFLTQTHAYKLKKPVRYEYLDFTTLPARERDCRAELRLNRALAPDVYLDVVPLAIDSGGTVRLEGEGAVVEWLVKMRRLPAERMLDRLIRARSWDESDIERVAQVLIDFYRAQPPVAMSTSAYRAQFEQMIALNRAVLARPRYALAPDRVAAPHDALSRILASAPEMFDRRVRENRIIEAHGDLRPEHICLERRPVIFDRLEFRRDFRVLDAVDELSYLAMECERLGAPEIGQRIFHYYCAASGDRPPESLRLFYSAHRACVRARLAVSHMDELEPTPARKWFLLAEDYLALASEYCRRMKLPEATADLIDADI